VLLHQLLFLSALQSYADGLSVWRDVAERYPCKLQLNYLGYNKTDSAANAVLSLPHFPSCEADIPEKEVILGGVVPLAHEARSVRGLAWLHPPGKALRRAVTP